MIWLFFELTVIAIVFLLIFCALMVVILGLLAEFWGAPFVPSNYQEMKAALELAKIKKGEKFVDLGSGEGSAVRWAAKYYQAVAIGYEIHPMLVGYSRFVSWIQNLKKTNFYNQNLFSADISDVHVLYLFLLPKTLAKLKDKLERELPKGTRVIAHGFKIPGWDKKLKTKIDRKLFPTYLYIK